MTPAPSFKLEEEEEKELDTDQINPSVQVQSRLFSQDTTVD